MEKVTRVAMVGAVQAGGENNELGVGCGGDPRGGAGRGGEVDCVVFFPARQARPKAKLYEGKRGKGWTGHDS